MTLDAYDILARCLREAGDDVEAGLVATEAILLAFSSEEMAATLAVDSEGHEHRGKGKAGGQFVGRGKGGSNGDTGNPERPANGGGTDSGNNARSTQPGPTGTAPGRPRKRPFKPANIVTARVAQRALAPKADPRVVPKSLGKHLNSHQLLGTATAVSALDREGGFLLADGAGLGKTREILATSQIMASRGKKVVIVSPANIVKPDWNTNAIYGSLGKDAATMGIPMHLNRGDKPLKAGQVTVTTYESLEGMKGQVDKNTIILFDEAHGLKNVDSLRSQHGMEAASNSGGVLYATATPADRPGDIAYLFRTQLYGDEAPEEVSKRLNPDKVGTEAACKNTADMFDKLTADGLMIKREISLDGVEAHFDHVTLPPEAQETVKTTTTGRKFYGFGAKNRAQGLMRARYEQEKYKLPQATQSVVKELSEGRQAVVFVAGLESAAELRKQLITQRIHDVVELHGGPGSEGREGVNKFQSGTVRVLITTAQSGSTGHNFDDTVGNKPRTQIIVTAPFSAIDNAQIWGRTHRLTTKSSSRIRYLFADTAVDRWNANLIHKKVSSLGAIVAGEAQRQDVKLPEKEQALAVDAVGHHHRGKGKGGGQFISEFDSFDDFDEYEDDEWKTIDLKKDEEWKDIDLVETSSLPVEGWDDLPLIEATEEAPLVQIPEETPDLPLEESGVIPSQEGIDNILAPDPPKVRETEPGLLAKMITNLLVRVAAEGMDIKGDIRKKGEPAFSSHDTYYLTIKDYWNAFWRGNNAVITSNPEDRKKAEEQLGLKLTDDQLLSLSGGKKSGGRYGLQAQIRPHLEGDVPLTYISGNTVPFQTQIVLARKQSDGSLIARYDGIFLTKNARKNPWKSVEILAEQVRTLKELGVTNIECTAERGKDDQWIGYRVWPKHGFDGPIPFEARQKWPESARKKFKDVNTIQELYKAEGGQQMWETFGTTIDLGINLSGKEGDQLLKRLDIVKKRAERNARIKSEGKTLSTENTDELVQLAYDTGLMYPPCLPLLQRKSVIKPNVNAPLAVDIHGHEHRGPGPAGGQFVSQSSSTAHPGTRYGSKITLTPVIEMAAPRDTTGSITPVSTHTTLTKQETGRLGESIVATYLRDIEGISDTHALNAGRSNGCIDLSSDSMAPEVKSGLCSASKKAQQWRITFSMDIGEKELAEYNALTPAQQASWREKHQEACLQRKLDKLKEISEKVGRDIKPVTYTTIINPDTQIADIYKTDGYHQRIGWNSDQATYIGSVKYRDANVSDPSTVQGGYKEGQESTFTHDGKKYSVDDALDIVKDKPIKHMHVDELSWILKYAHSTGDRTKNANTSVPVLVTKWGDKYVVIDGTHRLRKAVDEEHKTIPTREITAKELKSIEKGPSTYKYEG